MNQKEIQTHDEYVAALGVWLRGGLPESDLELGSIELNKEDLRRLAALIYAN